jgi:hypothetical protein
MNSSLDYLGGAARLVTEPGVPRDIGTQPPVIGGRVPAQSIALVGGMASGGAEQERAATSTYRKMRSDPTIALADSMICGPVLAASWQVEADEGVPDEWVEFIQGIIDANRADIVMRAMRAIQFGFAAFELVWGVDQQRRWVVRRWRQLIPETVGIVIDENNGTFLGLDVGEKHARLTPPECWVWSIDPEGDDVRGRPLYENVRLAWDEWSQVRNNASHAATKGSRMIPMVHYPNGTAVDPNGRTITNYEAAMLILGNLATGRGVALPNLAGDDSALRANPDLAGKSQWVISFLEAAGAASTIGALTERQRYLDALKLRGMFVPERAGIEASQSGSRADSQSAGDVLLTTCERLNKSMAESLNRDGGLDAMLAYNFGPDAVGSVRIVAPPIADAKKAVFRSVVDAVLASPMHLDALLDQIDFDAILDAMELPKATGIVNVTAPAMPQPGEQPAVPVPVQGDSESTTSGILNGAQITAAISIVAEYREGRLPREAAIELLGKLGIEPDRAVRMLSGPVVSNPATINDPTPPQD